MEFEQPNSMSYQTRFFRMPVVFIQIMNIVQMDITNEIDLVEKCSTLDRLSSTMVMVSASTEGVHYGRLHSVELGLQI